MSTVGEMASVWPAGVIGTMQKGTYPIARPLFMYTNGEPTGEVGAYIKWIKSAEGQSVLDAKGYVPLPQ